MQQTFAHCQVETRNLVSDVPVNSKLFVLITRPLTLLLACYHRERQNGSSGNHLQRTEYEDSPGSPFPPVQDISRGFMWFGAVPEHS
jgi:hypothetical protein